MRKALRLSGYIYQDIVDLLTMIYELKIGEKAIKKLQTIWVTLLINWMVQETLFLKQDRYCNKYITKLTMIKFLWLKTTTQTNFVRSGKW